MQLGALGANVVVADLHSETDVAAVPDITSAGGSAIAVVGDLSDRGVVEHLVSETLSTYGVVDILINNAGIMDDMSGPHEVSDAIWEKVLRVNLTAPFLLMRAVVPHMLEVGKGAIVNITSEAGPTRERRGHGLQRLETRHRRAN